MTKNIKKFIFLLNAICIFGYVNIAKAVPYQNPGNTFRSVSSFAGFQTNNASAQSIIIAVIAFVLGLMAVIFVALMIIAGIQWMTAGGNEEKIDKAKSRLKNAVIGFFIVMISYSITVFLNNMFMTTSY